MFGSGRVLEREDISVSSPLSLLPSLFFPLSSPLSLLPSLFSPFSSPLFLLPSLFSPLSSPLSLLPSLFSPLSSPLSLLIHFVTCSCVVVQLSVRPCRPLFVALSPNGLFTSAATRAHAT